MDPDPHKPRCEPDRALGPPPLPHLPLNGGGKRKGRASAFSLHSSRRDPELSRRAARAPACPGRSGEPPEGAGSPRSQPGSACAAGARSRPPLLLFNRPRCASPAWIPGDRLVPFPAGHTMGLLGLGRPGSTRSQATRNVPAPRGHGDPSELA